MRRLTTLWIGLVVGLCMPALVAAQNTYYAMKTANPGNTCTPDGQTITTAQNTIQNGWNCLSSGDTLIIMGSDSDGIWDEMPTFSGGGTVGNPITVTKEPGVAVTIAPSDATCAADADGRTLNLTDLSYTIIRGISLTDRLKFDQGGHPNCDRTIHGSGTGTEVEIAYTEHTRAKFSTTIGQLQTAGRWWLHHNYLYDTGELGKTGTGTHGFYIRGANSLIEYNTIVDLSGGNAIQLGTSNPDIDIRFNYIKNSERQCIIANSQVSPARFEIYGNVLIDCGRINDGPWPAHGIRLFGNAECDECYIANNTIINSVVQCIIVEEFNDDVTVQNNVCFDGNSNITDNGRNSIIRNNACPSGSLCGPSAVIVAAGDFTNTATEEYTVAPGSALINAGTATAVPAGYPFTGATPDIGAFQTTEYVSGTIDGAVAVLTLGTAYAPYLAPNGCAGLSFANISGNPTCVSVIPNVDNTLTVTNSSPADPIDSGISVSYAGTHWADTVGIGGPFLAVGVHQPVLPFTAQPVTNNTGPNPPSGAASRLHNGRWSNGTLR